MLTTIYHTFWTDFSTFSVDLCTICSNCSIGTLLALYGSTTMRVPPLEQGLGTMNMAMQSKLLVSHPRLCVPFMPVLILNKYQDRHRVISHFITSGKVKHSFYIVYGNDSNIKINRPQCVLCKFL